MLSYLTNRALAWLTVGFPPLPLLAVTSSCMVSQLTGEALPLCCDNRAVWCRSASPRLPCSPPSAFYFLVPALSGSFCCHTLVMPTGTTWECDGSTQAAVSLSTYCRGLQYWTNLIRSHPHLQSYSRMQLHYVMYNRCYKQYVCESFIPMMLQGFIYLSNFVHTEKSKHKDFIG